MSTTTAFVLSGGGSLGAVQVGMLEALVADGVRPDVVVGTSVGALNAAWIASHPWPQAVEGLDRLWRTLRRDDVFPTRTVAGVLGLLGRRNFLVPPEHLERLLRQNLPVMRFEDLAITLHVVATEVLTGLEVMLSNGSVVTALMASSALPGVFPPVHIDGRDLIDGGVTDNTPISHAVSLGADIVYVLATGYACALPAPPRNPLGMLLHTLTLLVEQRLIVDVARYEHEVDLRLLPPLCPLAISPTDFGHTAELIERARGTTTAWLRRGRPAHGQARFLGLHRHGEDHGSGICGASSIDRP